MTVLLTVPGLLLINILSLIPISRLSINRTKDLLTPEIPDC